MFILYTVIGIISGFLAGLLGIGGGLLFSAVLFYIFSNSGLANPVKWTVGTSLFCVFTTSLSSIYRHYKHENVYIRESLKIGVAGVIGTVVGTLINRSGYYNKEQFVVFFCIVLAYSAYSFIKSNRVAQISNSGTEKEIHLKDALLIGGIGGSVATLAGVGGGVVIVPFLTLVYHKSIYKTVSISAFSIMWISMFGWLQFALLYHPLQSLTSHSVGYLDFGTALPLIIGGFIGARLGVWANQKIKPKILHWIFATFALLIAIRLIVETYL
jgi:uncharacterized membrane protein YfcA